MRSAASLVLPARLLLTVHGSPAIMVYWPKPRKTGLKHSRLCLILPSGDVWDGPHATKSSRNTR